MLYFALSFLMGDLLLLHFNFLPKAWSASFIIFFIIFFVYRFKIKYYPVLIVFLCGFYWSLLYSHHQLLWDLPKDIEGKTVEAIGYIKSIPDYTNHQATFLFKLTQLNNKSVNAKIKLSWHNSPGNLKVGDRWKVLVRLKRIHGLMNPGGFDYETWAFEEGVRATGYIIDSQQNSLINHSGFYPINQLRQNIKNKIENALSKSETSPWIVALSVGERNGIDQKEWEVLRNTGTNHLMAIAGLHIGSISGFIFALVNLIWRRFPKLILILPSSHAGAIAALVFAISYSTLAGFSIPTQRACIMLATFSVFLLIRRHNSAWNAWATGLIIVLLINPLSVLSESFYLSFGSVALIIYGVSGRLNPSGLWWKLAGFNGLLR